VVLARAGLWMMYSAVYKLVVFSLTRAGDKHDLQRIVSHVLTAVTSLWRHVLCFVRTLYMQNWKVAKPVNRVLRPDQCLPPPQHTSNSITTYLLTNVVISSLKFKHFFMICAFITGFYGDILFSFSVIGALWSHGNLTVQTAEMKTTRVAKFSKFTFF